MKYSINPRTAFVLVSVFLVSLFAFIAVGEAAENPPEDLELLPSFDLYFQTFAIMANDGDFDRSKPIYARNGQTTGSVLTTFMPGLTWNPMNNITIRYQLEIGDNVWSRNDLDNQDPNSESTAVVRHKEVWGEVIAPSEEFGIRTGYMYFYDPTHLVIDRHLGMAQLFGRWSDGRVTLAAGQIPDTTYEGLDAQNDTDRTRENNFEQDDYVFAMWTQFGARKTWKFSPGLVFIWDKTEVARPKGVLSGVANVQLNPSARVNLEFDAVAQYGQYVQGGLNNRDVNYLAGALQAGAHFDLDPVRLDYNILGFTADDGDKYDQYDTGFHYSGWSKSKLMIFARNWIHDQYNNLDENVAAQGAGLVMGDQTFSYYLHEKFRLMAIIGAAMTLDGTNTDDSQYLGTEGHVGCEFAPYRDHVSFLLLAGGALPGKAAGVLKN